MTSTPLLANPLVYAAAILSVALASQQAGLISARSGSSPNQAIERPVPAAQTVNRAAKGDKQTSTAWRTSGNACAGHEAKGHRRSEHEVVPAVSQGAGNPPTVRRQVFSRRSGFDLHQTNRTPDDAT
ncbi:MAG TPA: hypothetical protein VIU42_04305 [Xanthobacteraceae bacterium]